MSRNARDTARKTQQTPTGSPDRPQQRPFAEAARTNAAPSFPFARTAEDDELRDLSGYGWGI